MVRPFSPITSSSKRYPISSKQFVNSCFQKGNNSRNNNINTRNNNYHHYHFLCNKKIFCCSRKNTCLSMMMSTSLSGVPRGAVSTTVRCELFDTKEIYYLLIQRGKEPNMGMWSLPGGSQEYGEGALQAGKRELMEETKFDDLSIMDNLQWYNGTFCTTDSIIVRDNNDNENNDNDIIFHYLIAHCFANIKTQTLTLPVVKPADDAAGAKWWTLHDIATTSQPMTPGLYVVIKRAEDLYQKGLLS